MDRKNDMDSRSAIVPNLKRFVLTNADGWPSKVNRMERTQDGVTIFVWSLADGRRLEPSVDGRYLALPGGDMLFMLPIDED